MATYITRQDYIDLGIIAEETLNELTQFDDNIINNIEASVLAFITSHINSRFDAATELAKTGSNRHPLLLRYGCDIGAYYLHRKISPNQVPENVLDGYIEAKDWFKKVSQGYLNPTGIATYSDGERDYIKYGGETRRENRI